MVVSNCVHRRRDSAHLGGSKCVYHFTPLAQRRVNDLVLKTDFLWSHKKEVRCLCVYHLFTVLCEKFSAR